MEKRTSDRAEQETAEVMLGQWCTGIRISHRAQEQAAATFDARGRRLSVASLAISTVVGTAIFASLSSSPAAGWKIVAGLLSLAAAVLSSLQFFMRYAERADTHHRAARQLGRLRHRVETVLAAGKPEEEMESLASEWDDLQEHVPVVPPGIYHRVEKEVMQGGRRPKHG
ncbi:DUF4231 domain-containing protein [Streptomyces iakyrus]|uniref:DUF4231 domain-containing protein n=1 Tax=Streptomyces iakyrus TaxID=68219 RepID=UPI0036E8D118